MAPISALESLSNALATPAQLSTSSSSLDGVPSDLETSIRYAGAQLTQAAGVLLRLSQDIIAQAIVTFTRFWIGPEGGSLGIYAAKVGARLGRVRKRTMLRLVIQTGRVCRCPLSDREALVPAHVSSLRPECLRLPALQGSVSPLVHQPQGAA